MESKLSSEPSPSSLAVQPDPSELGQALSLESRSDAHGVVTYHVQSADARSGVFFEKVYDQEHHLIKLEKRAPGSRCETFYSPCTGAVVRLCESQTLFDGNSMTRNVIYGDDRSTEAVIVLAPNGNLVRRVERHHIGLRIVFQGQTEYEPDGSPGTTVNHFMDAATSHLVKREQIQWQCEGQRSLTETFHFDRSGNLSKYVKVLYHCNAGPFVRETRYFHIKSQTLEKREIAAFGKDGKQTCLDLLMYDEEGEIAERHSMFFDREGREIASLNY